MKQFQGLFDKSTMARLFETVKESLNVITLEITTTGQEKIIGRFL